ncbi:type 1 glutamine amidotransferase [Halorarius litoreus]|uniref:type 1 glutamine amidotransferase n=1 Tax=Halorarius litoreus TaxID=2962676 RepID=UPI0020CC177B|nr:type 1 glutamine amidotransferase [Halorarius litoreus]
MILVLENEVDPEVRYFVDELTEYLPDHRVYDYVAAGTRPDIDDVDAVIVAGSTAGVYEAADHAWIDDEAAFVRDLVSMGMPTLGVCFGHQLVNEALGGRVEHRGFTNELVEVELADDPLFEGVSSVLPAVHGDHVVSTGDGMELIASAPHNRAFATRHRDAPVWTVQFHPEFTEVLCEPIRADFGWQENEYDFADVTGQRVLSNFTRLADA